MRDSPSREEDVDGMPGRYTEQVGRDTLGADMTDWDHPAQTSGAGDATAEAPWEATVHARAEERTKEDELIAFWVRPDPSGRGPAAYRVGEGGPEVWALAGYLAEAGDMQLADPDSSRRLLALAADDFDLPLPAVVAALVFYQRQRRAIDARAEANRPAPAGVPTA